jgi:hypothetical protein
LLNCKYSVTLIYIKLQSDRGQANLKIRLQSVRVIQLSINNINLRKASL